MTAAFLMTLAVRLEAATNGAVSTAPMGVNTWYSYAWTINESIIKSFADQMATNGMREAGYTYLNLDDGWQGPRDANGGMQAHPGKFPSGMKALADYVHSKGLKFGLYAVGGSNTCAGYPGSMGYEIQDAQTMASWGVDYVKFEGCDMPWYELLPHQELFSARMGQALKQTGRSIVFSLSTSSFERWIPGACNLPRETGDWNYTWTNALFHFDVAANSPFKARPGMFNDPDVLPISGIFNQTDARAVMSMWSMLAAPLLTAFIGADRLEVLCNPEVVAVDQDPACIQGWCVSSNGDAQVWCKPLGASNSTTLAVMLLNRGGTGVSIAANWSDLGLPPGVAQVRNLWERAYEANGPQGDFCDSYTASLSAHEVKLLKITGGGLLPLPPVGTIFVSDLAWLAGTTNQSVPIGRNQRAGTAMAPMTIDGITYPKGLSFQAYSRADYYLGKAASRFQCTIGIDDAACCGSASAVFRVYADGVMLFDSAVMNDGSAPQTIDLDVSGRNILSLELSDGGDGPTGDIGDWANARLLVIPRPQVGQIQMNGNSLALAGSNGTPGGIYYLLASTNVGLPMSQWVPIRTNYFDNNGNFVLSNLAVSNGPAVFFRLSTQ